MMFLLDDFRILIARDAVFFREQAFLIRVFLAGLIKVQHERVEIAHVDDEVLFTLSH
jgi:hypothetical protein